MNNDFILSGSTSQQAQQFFNLLRERELTPEQMNIILPKAKDFYTKLIEVLHKETEANKDCYKTSIVALQNTLLGLVSQLSSTVTREEKEELLKVILEIQKSIKEIEINRTDKSYGFRKFIAFLGSLLVFVLIILGASKIGKSKSEA